MVPHETSGKLMPLDTEPNDDGNVIVYQSQPYGRWVAHVIKQDVTPPVGTLMMPHFATCPSYVRKR
jgi:hypothetical protein